MIEKLGVINVPALVEYLRVAHPHVDPFALAAKVVSLVDAGPYTMGFDPLQQPE